MKKFIIPALLISLFALLSTVLFAQDSVEALMKKDRDKQTEIRKKSEEHQKRIIEKFNRFYNEVLKFAPDLKLRMPMDPGYADAIKENNHPTRKRGKEYFAYVAEPYRLRSWPSDSTLDNSIPVKKGVKVRVLMMPDTQKDKGKVNVTDKWALVKLDSGDERYIPIDMLMKEPPGKSGKNTGAPALRSGAPVLRSDSDMKKEVTVSSLNVRSEPNQYSAKLDSLYRGNIVDVLEYSDNDDYIDGRTAKWAKVRYRYMEGWVFSAYLGSVSQDKGRGSDELMTSFRQGERLYVKSDILRVRDVPSPDGTVLFSLQHRDKIQITEILDEEVSLAGKKSKWVGVKHNDYEGYVFGAFLGPDSSGYLEGDDIDKLFIFPFNDPNLPITSNYGWRTLRGRKNFHKGIDISARQGTPVLAAADGSVISVRADSRNCSTCGYGNCVIIQHNNGHRTLYAHLSSIDVNMGQKLTAGEPVGKAGNTGHSYGSHLHFEIISYEEHVDPSTYMHAHLFLLNDLMQYLVMR